MSHRGKPAELPRSAARVQAAANDMNLAIAVRQMSASTRTAEEAAGACGCDVAQIVKSLIFRGRTSQNPLLLLVSGANRVHEQHTARRIGEALGQADADFVREATGFAIGGVPPFGHDTPIATYMDTDLLAFDRVWAAAGTPRCLFSVSPRALQSAISATVIDVT